jgi:hypothetical protein
MSEPVTIERVERGLVLLAYLIARDGPVYAPLFEKLERKLESLRARDDTVGRAKRLLENLGSPMQCKLLDAEPSAHWVEGHYRVQPPKQIAPADL